MGYRYTETQQCKRCKRTRTLGAFAKLKIGRSAVCFPCQRRKPRIPRLGNWQRFKLTLRGEPFTETHFEELHAKQGGRCLICREIPKERLHVDHDHKTGIVRGLLCRDHNIALGYFRDRPLLALRAAHYLVGSFTG